MYNNKKTAAMKIRFRDTGKLLKTSFKEWWEKDPFRQSAVIAYYAIFSLPALLVLIITLAGYFFGAEAVSEKVLSQVSDTMGQETSEQVKEMLAKAQSSKASIWATIIGVITLLVGATGVFVELQKTLNIIWEVKAEPKKGIWPLIKARLFSFGLILSIAFLLLISLVVSTILSSVGDFVHSDSSQALIIVFNIINFIFSIVVISFLFALMFKFLPDAKIKWGHVWVGAIVTGVLFTIGKTALAFYFGKAEPGSGYGAAGSIILILLWVSYSSMILFFGAEFTRAYANLYSGTIPPTENAEKEKVSAREKQL
jgi:membrane protein